MTDVAALMAALDAELGGQQKDCLSPATFLLLQDVWGALDGGRETGMSWRKLSPERVEQPCWERPVLTFVIERHGRTAQGSSRADLYEWRINLAARTAEVRKHGYRQLVPNDKPLNAKKLAAEVAALIGAQSEAKFLVWSKDKRSVRLIISEVVPATNAQTTSARRRRFRDALEEQMAALGWSRTGLYRFTLASEQAGE